jgi:hypothetical protein
LRPLAAPPGRSTAPTPRAPGPRARCRSGRRPTRPQGPGLRPTPIPPPATSH